MSDLPVPNDSDQPPAGTAAPLSANELAERDRRVGQAKAAYDAVRRNSRALAAALLFILRNRLFRDHDSFGAFVEATFEFSADYGHKHVRWARLNECLVAAGEAGVEVESQGRKVTALLEMEPNSDYVSEENAARAVRAVRAAREAAARGRERLAAHHFADARRLLFGDADEEGTSGSPNHDAATKWPWSEKARDRFARVPKAHRPDVLESLTFASLSEEVTPEVVDEAAEAVRSNRDAKAGRPGWPVVVGVAVAVVEHNRRQLLGDDHPELLDSGLPHDPIADLDYVVPVDAEGYTPTPGAPRAPLLVVIPLGLCPDALLDAHPGAREKAEGRAEVIVEVGELEAFGGPFTDVLDEHGHRMLDLQTIREASRKAGIRKTLHPAGPGIEWAMWAGNTSAGCSHGCARRFCYASDFALLFFPQAFVPTVWPARLDAFANSDPPDPDTLPEHLRAWSRTVFHGSMTDLMNWSFPDYWVQAVIDAIAESPKWNVVVLTKLAPRLTDFEWPRNAVVGVTVTGPEGVRAAARALGALKGDAEKWISVEPFFEGFDPAPLVEAGARFFAVGAQTATRWAGEIQPSARDVARMAHAVLSAGAYYFPKSNLDHRGHIPFGGADPYDGWSPTTSERGPTGARPPARRPVRPKGPGSSVAA